MQWVLAFRPFGDVQPVLPGIVHPGFRPFAMLDLPDQSVDHSGPPHVVRDGESVFRHPRSGPIIIRGLVAQVDDRQFGALRDDAGQQIVSQDALARAWFAANDQEWAFLPVHARQIVYGVSLAGKEHAERSAVTPLRTTKITVWVRMNGLERGGLSGVDEDHAGPDVRLEPPADMSDLLACAFGGRIHFRGGVDDRPVERAPPASLPGGFDLDLPGVDAQFVGEDAARAHLLVSEPLQDGDRLVGAEFDELESRIPVLVLAGDLGGGGRLGLGGVQAYGHARVTGLLD